MSKFAIFAHARSGSTSLAKVLADSPDVKIAIEPFHPKYSKWNPEEPDYSFIVKDKISMNKALDELFSKYTAIKVLQYQFPDKIYLELLKRKELKILFLRRKDYKGSAISSLIAEQTNVWQKKDAKTEIDYSKLEPLSISRIKEMIEYVSSQMELYESFLEKNRKNDYMKLYYEELFSEDQERNIQKVRRICKFLEIEMPSSITIKKHMTPSESQINSKGDYRKISNYQEILDAIR